MKVHIIFIGGTGARVYRALIHCMASGMFHDMVPNDLEMYTYLIDPDTYNGDGVRAREISMCYQSICKKIKPSLSLSNNLKDCPLFGIPLYCQEMPLSTPWTAANIPLNGDTYMFLSALLGNIGEWTANIEMAIYLLMSSVSLTSFENNFDPYTDKVIIVGGSFGKTGYIGMAKIACRISRLHSRCRVAIVPIGTYYKVSQKEYQYFNLFFTRDSLLKMFCNDILRKEFHKISFYDICLSNREVSVLKRAEGGLGQQNPSHVVELCAASAIFDLIKTTWEGGDNFSFDMSAMKAGYPIGVQNFPYKLRKPIDRLLCFSIWCRHFGGKTDSIIKGSSHYTLDFCNWIKDMEQNTISFNPIDFSSKELSKSFNWYKPNVQHGFFRSDPLDSKSLDIGFKKAIRSSEDSLSEERKTIKAQYEACADAWKQFKKMCRTIS